MLAKLREKIRGKLQKKVFYTSLKSMQSLLCFLPKVIEKSSENFQ